MSGIGRRWQLGVFHALIRLAGRPLSYALADLVSLHYTLTRPSVRQGCRPYLDHRFHGRRGLRRLADTFRLTRSFARILVDQAALRLLGRGEFITHLQGRADLAALLAEGRGLVIVTAHVGAWQLGMAGLGGLERPISVLARFDAGDESSPFQAFAGRDFRVIDPGAFLGGVPDMVGALQRGEVVALMGDRAWGAGGGTVAVDFLGGPVPLPFTAYKLASATGAPVAVLFPYKAGPDRYEMHLASVIRVPAGLGRAPEAYRPYAAAYARALEAFLGTHPYHFFNFFDLWAGKTGPG
ncbi:lysophospholipid acyltransferase family protein [Mesoterricola silvestris]|uniref:lysophospholipid acyltransferase family protein n=1 Tax=Mesoterricola silvestris TaxID=2927979 RepID=UPI00292EC7A5|nr:lysophospholipid acyltransferase family protein [Mesoterricola silvestris]